MYVTSLEVDYDSFYSAMTSGMDVTVELWCVDQCDVLYLRGGDIDDVVEHLETYIGVRDTVQNGNDEQILVTEQCLMDLEECRFKQVVDQHDGISLPPHTYADGNIKARVAAQDDDKLSDIYNDLMDSFSVSVGRKQDVSNVPPDVPLLVPGSSLPDLSKQQRRAIRVAHREGYYDIPRGCTTDDIASELGVSRRTAQEHLRRAEQKFVDCLVDFV